MMLMVESETGCGKGTEDYRMVQKGYRRVRKGYVRVQKGAERVQTGC
jgi:hypothetical protein